VSRFLLPQKVAPLSPAADESVTLAAGVLRYDSLTGWMGYSVDYDWVRPWLLAACLMALLSLSLHYLSWFRAD